MHPVWNRCLQGISLTVSCSSNSSKHTGHFSALSVKRKKRAWGKLKKNDSHGHQGSNSIKLAANAKYLSELLPIILLLMFLVWMCLQMILNEQSVTCLFWGDDDHRKTLNHGFGCRRRETLVPIRQIKWTWVYVKTLHQRPIAAWL